VAPDIWIKAAAAYVTLRNLNIVGTAPATTLQMFGDYTTLQNLDITNNHSGRSCIVVGDYEGTYKRIVSGFVLDHSKVHDCGMLAYGAHDHGIYLASTRNAAVTGNWFWGNQGGWGIQVWADAHRSEIANNVIDGNYNGNVLIAGGNYSADGPSSNNMLERNIFSSPRSRYQVESYWEGGTRGTNNVVRDSCVYGSTSSGAFDTQDAGFTTSNIITTNPMFVDRPNHDYTLQAGSPCAAYGAGGTVGVTS